MKMGRPAQRSNKRKKFVLCRKKQNNEAQVFMEYTILFGLIVAAIMAMAPMIKRGTQAMVKIVADQVGNQEASEQSRGEDGKDGYMVSSTSSASIVQEKRVRDRLGYTNYTYNDTIDTQSVVIVNQGYTDKY